MSHLTGCQDFAVTACLQPSLLALLQVSSSELLSSPQRCLKVPLTSLSVTAHDQGQKGASEGTTRWQIAPPLMPDIMPSLSRPATTKHTSGLRRALTAQHKLQARVMSCRLRACHCHAQPTYSICELPSHDHKLQDQPIMPNRTSWHQSESASCGRVGGGQIRVPFNVCSTACRYGAW